MNERALGASTNADTPFEAPPATLANKMSLNLLQKPVFLRSKAALRDTRSAGRKGLDEERQAENAALCERGGDDSKQSRARC